ncbi:MOSC N-terminal beta barrel domain-containing protein [Flammula alnicola]|nr:MOSC N-terminal beta barrel domain-containing protein [Flammula alnicola]
MTSASRLPPLALTMSHGLDDLLRSWTTLALLLPVILVVYRLWRSQRTASGKTVDAKEYLAMSHSSAKAAPSPGDVRVSKILIHPIKSCRGLSVPSARYTPEGLENDRIWCIIDAVKLKIITAREVPKMVLITPSIETDGTLKVAFPEDSGCEAFSIPLRPTEDTLNAWTIIPQILLWPGHNPLDGYICESAVGPKGVPSEMLSKYFEKPVHLVYKGPQPRKIDATTLFPELNATAKYQDMYPLLVLSEESTVVVEKELRGHVGTQGIDERWRTDSVPIERFRPNLIVRGGGPFAEDDWEEISIGSESAPLITLVSKCTRCLLPNVSPETGERDNAVPYKVLMKFRTGLDPGNKMKPCVGCNAVPSGNGGVSVGDWVYVKKMIKNVEASVP